MDNRPQSVIELVDGEERYRGLRVQRHRLSIGGRTLTIAGLVEAADLLDHPDFAKRFLDENRAPYGLQLWTAAIMLAQHILDGPPGAGRSAVELGSGLGLVSVAAAMHGWRVTATDREEEPLRFAKFNAELNGAAIDGFERLDWHDPPSHRRFDRIFAADVLYEREDHVAILRCINGLLASGGVALVCDPNRSAADGMESLARESDFDVAVTPIDAADLDGRPVSGRIYRLRRD